MNYNDYIGATNTASQLAILSPDDPMIRSFELKSRAFRDLFVRPTALLDQEVAYELLRSLSKADQWRIDATGANDPDIAASFSLIAFQSYDSNADLMKAVILTRKALEAKQKEAEIDPDSSSEGQQVDQWEYVVQSLAQSSASLEIDPQVLAWAFPNAGGEDVKLLAEQYIPQTLPVKSGSAWDKV